MRRRQGKQQGRPTIGVGADFGNDRAAYAHEDGDFFEELDLGCGDEDDDQAPDKKPDLSSRVVLKRDKYGFLLTEEAFQELKSYLDRNRYTHPSRVQRWAELVGAEELLQSNPGYYAGLLGCEHLFQYHVLRQIRMDMARTFPSNAFFQALDGLQRLERILVAYAARNPDVGYCQGMNYIAGFLLLMVEEEDAARCHEAHHVPLTAVQKEERVFWLLVCIVERRCYNRGYYIAKAEMFSLKMDCLVLKRLTQQLQPRVHKRINEFPKCPIWMVLAASWFITLFIDSLPSEPLIKVWDAYALEGRVVLFRVAVALLRLSEDAVLNSSDVNIVSVVRNRTRSYYNCSELIDTAFSREIVGAVTADRIADIKRTIYADMLHTYERSIGWWEYCFHRRVAPRGVLDAVPHDPPVPPPSRVEPATDDMSAEERKDSRCAIM
eukprot:Hpha_TRINITY_DN17153_c0_g1::TRINITY_DN17153_c0_g1_i1::g.146794::m.146794/K19953/GRTP1, TBC1D6, MSB3_4; TBC1 domain family member 6